MSDSTQKGFLSALWASIFSGGLAGASEVFFDHPFWTLKTRYQNDKIPKNQKFTLDPRVLYRGFMPNIFSMVPITALQVGISEGLSKLFHTPDVNPPSDLNALSYNAIGGGTSALVGGPTELAMAQQTKERGFFSTLKNIYTHHGFRGLAVGLPGTIMRDAKFTIGFGFLSPYIKNKLSPYLDDNAAKVGGGIGAGLPVAILSQPWDTLRTIQQTQMQLVEKVTAPITPMWEIAKKTVQKEGIRGLYKGCEWRMARVASAVCIMSEVNERTKEYMKPKG